MCSTDTAWLSWKKELRDNMFVYLLITITRIALLRTCPIFLATLIGHANEDVIELFLMRKESLLENDHIKTKSSIGVTLLSPHAPPTDTEQNVWRYTAPHLLHDTKSRVGWHTLPEILLNFHDLS